eukprot:EG_transcript_8646
MAPAQGGVSTFVKGAVLLVAACVLCLLFAGPYRSDAGLGGGAPHSAPPRWEFDYVPQQLLRIRHQEDVRLARDTTAPFPEADIVVVGAGLSGAVIAERYARLLGKRVLVLERRPHIAGNCYDYVDSETGVLVNLYGAHLFHTKFEDVWNYVQQFSGWVQYHHRVRGLVDGKIVPIPVNIETVNKLLGLTIRNTDDMRKWLAANQVKPAGGRAPANGEEAALARVGQVLYQKIFKEYTVKQWAKEPKELAASVLNRIPVRDDWNDRYFPEDKYQYLPAEGYTKLFESMLSHPNITVRLGVDYFKVKDRLPRAEKLFFTGPIDDYFSQKGWKRLEYRSIIFEKEYGRPQPSQKYFQSASVVNYPEAKYNFTRIVEYNQFPTMRVTKENAGWRGKGYTQVLVKEYSTDQGEPYYPVPNERNQALYRKYQQMAEAEQASGVHFVGRLASYKYFNMDQAIKNALDLFTQISGVPAMKLEPLLGRHCGTGSEPPISDSLN